MCMLSVIPANVEPDYEGLLNGGISNPDGSGWAIAVDGKIIMGKQMDACDAIDEFSLAREKYPHGPALFHSRWATHGTTSIYNVHPFFVGNSYQTVVAHNGILQCTPNKNDARSDTRLFAEEILPTRFKRLDKRRAFTALSQYAGTYNKLAILTVDSRYHHNLYIVNEVAGHWDKLSGNWHSNYDYLGYSKYSGYGSAVSSWKPSTKATVAIGKPKTEDSLDPTGLCYICEFGYYDSSGYCDQCGTCMDCMEFRNDCQCYLGAEWNKARETEWNGLSAEIQESLARIAALEDMS